MTTNVCLGGLMLAPMVRCGTLPMRLLALRQGASLVYTEEIIDSRLITAKRVYNEKHNTIDFIDDIGAAVYRTCDEERNQVVLQLGTASAEKAVQAARVVSDTVAMIDINCGCPKHFSMQGGMGAALLRKPDVLCDIIQSLKNEINVPISCKIRLLDSIDETVDLLKKVQRAGAVAAAVHVRHIHERPKDPAHWDWLPEIVRRVDIPIFANGDIWTRDDACRMLSMSNCAGILLARGALSDCSIFGLQLLDEDSAKPRPLIELARDYLRIAARLGNHFLNTKYCTMSMLKEAKALNTDIGKGLQQAKSFRALAVACGIEDEICKVLLEAEIDPDAGKPSKRESKQNHAVSTAKQSSSVRKPNPQMDMNESTETAKCVSTHNVPVSNTEDGTNQANSLSSSITQSSTQAQPQGIQPKDGSRKLPKNRKRRREKELELLGPEAQQKLEALQRERIANDGKIDTFSSRPRGRRDLYKPPNDVPSSAKPVQLDEAASLRSLIVKTHMNERPSNVLPKQSAIPLETVTAHHYDDNYFLQFKDD